MADKKRALAVNELFPKGFIRDKMLDLLVLQLEKDLRIAIENTFSEELILQVMRCLEQNAIQGELLPLLYRVDLNEEIASKLVTTASWYELAIAVTKRIALKVALRYSSNDQK